MTKQNRTSNLSFLFLALVICLCMSWIWQNEFPTRLSVSGETVWIGLARRSKSLRRDTFPGYTE